MTAGASRRTLFWGVLALAVAGLFMWTAPGTCSLLVASYILAYICAPAVERHARRMPRPMAVAIVLAALALGIAGIVLLLVPVVIAQWTRLAERLPGAVAWAEHTLVPWVEARFGVEIPDTGTDLAQRLQGHLATIGGRIAAPLGQLVAKTFGGVIGIAGAIAHALLAPVLAFYLLVNWRAIWPRVESIVPHRHVARVRGLKEEIDKSMAGFVRGHLTVSAIIGVLQAVGLSIVGIDGAIVIGLLGGFLNMIPYLGVAIGLTLALLMAALSFSGWAPILGVLVVFAIVQVLEGTVITPRILGERVGLSPLFVIIAILAGGEMFGFAGLLLAIPGAAVLRVLLREALATYRASPAYALAGATPSGSACDPPGGGRTLRSATPSARARDRSEGGTAMYVVLGASGNTGRVVAEKLLAAGKNVRVVGRDAARLQALAARGAKTVVGRLEDAGVLAEAFDGATAVYAMIPPDVASADPLGQQQRVGEAIAGALREMRIRKCVSLSSVGAQNRSNAGPVSGLGRQEERLDAIPGLDVLHLRPGMFMENLYAYLPLIQQGVVASALEADLELPWIATRDIGAAAADELLGLEFTGRSIRELHGPRDLSWSDVIPVVGKAIGKPDLRYMQVSYADAEAGMIQAGLQPALAAAYVEMERAMNERRLAAVQPRSPRTTTPTTIEEFAREFARAIV